MVPGELEVPGPNPKIRFYANVGLTEGDEAGEGGEDVRWQVMRLKVECLEEPFAEGAHGESEPSVEVSGEHDVFALLSMQIDLSFGRDPRDHAVRYLSPPVEFVDIRLRDVRSLPGSPRDAAVILGIHLALDGRRDVTESGASAFLGHCIK